MEIQVIPVQDETAEQTGTKTLILVDKETLVEVRDFGTGHYNWRVTNVGRNLDYKPEQTLKDFYSPHTGWIEAEGSFGPGGVWLGEKTFAHAVMDLIQNQ